MKVELFYDPVRPETTVLLDGSRVDPSDIFGFLYPVRNCLLQTWLPESGSWSGLYQQLKELSRGEKVSLVFHGRESDYQDVSTLFMETPEIETSYLAWDPVTLENELILKAEKRLSEIISIHVLMEENEGVKNEKSLASVFPEAFGEIRKRMEQGAETPWFTVIRTPEEFLRAAREKGDCCIIEEGFLRSYADFAQLERLFRSMRRSQDMLLCRFHTKERMDEYRQYNAQSINYSVRFGVVGEESVVSCLEEKYGKIYQLRAERDRLNNCCHSLQECFSQKPMLDKRIRDLGENRSKEAIREKAQCKYKRRWLAHEQKRFDELMALLSCDLVDHQAAIGGSQKGG